MNRRTTPGYTAWPHPKAKPDDAVDPRMTTVIRRTLIVEGVPRPDRVAELVAERVWSWLAEGDRS